MLTPAVTEKRPVDWVKVAIVAQIAMMLYFVIGNHVDLYPWNNLAIAGNQLPSTLMGVVPFSIFAIAFARRWRPLMVFGTGWAWVWLALQIRQWWIPYLFGSTLLHRNFDWYFEGGYDETLRILPMLVEGRPIPDLQHNTLQLLSLFMAITMTLAVVQVYRRKLS
jgi:hypothetical protein